MKSKSTKLKSLLQKMAFKIGALLTVLMLLSFVDSNSLAEDVDSKSNDKITYMRADEYVLSKEQIKRVPDYIPIPGRRKHNSKMIMEKRTGVVGIEVTQKETLVDFTVLVQNSNLWWCIFSERTFLRDHATNDMYKIRSIKGGVPLGKLLVVKDHRNQYIRFTLVFPPLGEDVKKIDFIELMSEIVTSPSNGGALFTDYNLNVTELQIEKETSFKIIE